MGVEELCSIPVVNLMSAVFMLAPESTRKTCWHIFLCQYTLPMGTA